MTINNTIHASNCMKEIGAFSNLFNSIYQECDCLYDEIDKGAKAIIHNRQELLKRASTEQPSNAHLPSLQRAVQAEVKYWKGTKDILLSSLVTARGSLKENYETFCPIYDQMDIKRRIMEDPNPEEAEWKKLAADMIVKLFQVHKPQLQQIHQALRRGAGITWLLLMTEAL